MTNEEQIIKLLTEIRDELRAGRDANARRILGDPYGIDGSAVEEKRRNCRHFNRQGSGTVGSDGSSKWSWYCADCGASDEGITPPIPRPLVTVYPWS